MGEEMFEGRYCGPPPSPAGLWQEWNGDPVLLFVLFVALAATFRVAQPSRMTWAGCLGVLAIAFISPLCALSSALFSARAVHHLLIVAAAAPLLALVIRPASLTGPALALPLFTVVLWGWHVPSFYDAALNDFALYWIMQLSLLASAWLFWASVFAARAAPAAIALLGATMQMGFLGALLSFAPDPLYLAHDGTTAAFGLSQLGDQQLGGLLMWVPGMLPFAFWSARIAARQWRLVEATRT